MNCKLCLRPATLRLSHIISEFLYQDTYDEDHAARTISATLPYVRRLRRGLRELLLCDSCEKMIKRYEDYFARVWYTEGVLPQTVPAGTDAVVTDGLDYGTFKLFHLSILWRASVAASEDFQDVHLGPHEDAIRQMLLAGDPGPADRYRLTGCLILRPGTRAVLRSLVGVPAPGRVGGQWVYAMIYGGCLWNLVISSHAPVRLGETFSEAGRLVLSAVDAMELRSASGL